MKDHAASQIWRFEMRMGAKQLCNRFEMQRWQDLRDTIGDAYPAFFEKMRYFVPTSDSKRARWPIHPIWQAVQERVESGLLDYASGVIPGDVIYADKMQKWRELDAQLLGLFVTRAALSDVPPEEFEGFMDRHVQSLALISKSMTRALARGLGKCRGAIGWGEKGQVTGHSLRLQRLNSLGEEADIHYPRVLFAPALFQIENWPICFNGDRQTLTALYIKNLYKGR